MVDTIFKLPKSSALLGHCISMAFLVRTFLPRLSSLSADLSGFADVKSWQEQLANLPSGSRIGLDPSLISIGDHNTILPTLSKDSTLVPISTNLVDEIWADKPKRPAEPIVVHEKHAGKSMQEKLEEIRKDLRKKKENWGIVVGLLDEICCESVQPEGSKSTVADPILPTQGF